MADTRRKPPLYLRAIVHAVLLTGGAFFLLPLIWMIASSFKPLDQTMKPPTRLDDLLVGTGPKALLDGELTDVAVERDVRPGPDNPVYVVAAEEQFLAGELDKSFGPDLWNRYPIFNAAELERMNTPVTPGMRVLADRDNPYDPAAGTLQLRSGRLVRARLVRTIEPPPEGEKLVVVRRWLPRDTDAKQLGSQAGDVTRAWDVVLESRLQHAPRIIPENYPAALRKVHFSRSLANTLFLCTMVVVGTVVSSVLVAYGFAFLKFRGRSALFGLTMATMMIPFPVVMIPIFLLYRDLGWVGTFKPLWVTAWFGSAFFIFLLRQFFLGLPKDLLDAARIDGCTELQILWRVVVPLARPAIAMVALFTFLAAWKDFLGPLLYLNHPSQFTLSLSLQAFSSEQGGTPWHLLMAASTVFSLPLILLFFLTMKTFIRGTATAGIKG